MVKIALLVVAVTLSGCASTREESAIAFQQQLPQLVTACNTAFRDGSQFGFDIVGISDGIDACDRLAKERSLRLADPAAVKIYQSYFGHSRAPQDANCTYMASSTGCAPPHPPTFTSALQQPTTWPELPPPGSATVR
jgi:hypothetical protein